MFFIEELSGSFETMDMWQKPTEYQKPTPEREEDDDFEAIFQVALAEERKKAS